MKNINTILMHEVLPKPRSTTIVAAIWNSCFENSTYLYYCFTMLKKSCNWTWCSSHFAVTQVGNKNSNIQGRSPNVVTVIFHTIRNCS